MAKYFKLLFILTAVLIFRPIVRAQIITVAKVHFKGLKRTKESTLNKLIQLEGKEIAISDTFSVFSQAKIDLYNTKLFAQINHTTKTQGNNVIITFLAIERWYTYAMPYFDLIDRNFNAWWVTRNHELDRVIIGADITQKNTTGHNDDLSFSFLLGNQTRLGLEYELPNNFRNGKYGIGFSFQYHAHRNVNYNNANDQLAFLTANTVLLNRWLGQASLSFHFDFNRELWINIGFQHENVSSDVTDLNPNYNGIYGLEQLFFGFSKIGLRLDSRDVRGYAQKGQLLWGEVSGYSFAKQGQLNFIELNARYTRHIPFFKRGDLAVSSIVKLSPNKSRPYFLNRGIGWGLNSIRCYDYFVVDGNSFFAQKASFRFRAIDTKLNLKRIKWQPFQIIPFKAAPKIFFDVAYVNNSQYLLQGDFFNKPIYSYGVGLDLIVFDDAVWRFEYGLNHQGNAAFFLNFTSAIQ
ncbi:MAG: hypothetical protein JXQ87_02800 [Bacteroidia bacterium]